jgi:hypothetical protein
MVELFRAGPLFEVARNGAVMHPKSLRGRTRSELSLLINSPNNAQRNIASGDFTRHYRRISLSALTPGSFGEDMP